MVRTIERVINIWKCVVALNCRVSAAYVGRQINVRLTSDGDVIVVCLVLGCLPSTVG